MRLATCSWRAYRPEMGVAVRITLGLPPGWFRHPHEEVRLLAPPPHVFKLKDDATFQAAYGQHLEAVGVKRLMKRFQNLSEKHDGRRLVLLCSRPASRTAIEGNSLSGGRPGPGRTYPSWGEAAVSRALARLRRCNRSCSQPKERNDDGRDQRIRSQGGPLRTREHDGPGRGGLLPRRPAPRAA